MRFLALYTACEGAVEEIGYGYLRPVPLDIVETVLAPLPWRAETIGDLLAAVVRREDPKFSKLTMDQYERLRTGHPLSLKAEWKWATAVRNDLAHSSGQWVDHSYEPWPHPERWQLWPRTHRRPLKILKEPLTVDELLMHTARVSVLWYALLDVAAHLGFGGSSDHSGPGPKPV